MGILNTTSSYTVRYLKIKKCLLYTLLVFLLITCTILIYINPRCSRLCPYQSKYTGYWLEFDGSNFIEDYSEFVCPQNFRNLADWVYGWPENVFEEKLKIPTNKGYRISKCLPVGSIIYVKTGELRSFFHTVYPHLKNEFVLITGQGDESTPGPYISYLEKNESKIIHWYAQNAEIHYLRSAKFTHIPIGKCVISLVYQKTIENER